MAPQIPLRPTVPLESGNPETPRRVTLIQQPGGDMFNLGRQRPALRKSTAYNSVDIFTQDHLRLTQSKTTKSYDAPLSNVVKKLKSANLLMRYDFAELKIDARTEDATFANLCSIADNIHDLHRVGTRAWQAFEPGGI